MRDNTIFLLAPRAAGVKLIADATLTTPRSRECPMRFHGGEPLLSGSKQGTLFCGCAPKIYEKMQKKIV